MGIPNEAEVQVVFEPYEEFFSGVVLAGWTEAWALMQQRPWRTTRARANLVNDFIVDNALQDLPSIPGIRHIERHQTVFFVVENKFLMRFKQADRKGRSRNYPTQAANAYFNHNLSLFGPLDWPRVEVVHILNETQTGIKSVRVVARSHRRVVWGYPIWPEARKTEVLPFIPKEQPAAKDLWRSRQPKDREKVQDNEE